MALIFWGFPDNILTSVNSFSNLQIGNTICYLTWLYSWITIGKQFGMVRHRHWIDKRWLSLSNQWYIFETSDILMLLQNCTVLVPERKPGSGSTKIEEKKRKKERRVLNLIDSNDYIYDVFLKIMPFSWEFVYFFHQCFQFFNSDDTNLWVQGKLGVAVGLDHVWQGWSLLPEEVHSSMIFLDISTWWCGRKEIFPVRVYFLVFIFERQF